jgi:FG-GAP-like repeat
MAHHRALRSDRILSAFESCRINRRRFWSIVPWLVRLEDRRLLAGGALGAGAPLSFGSAIVGNLGSNGAAYYQISPPAGGRLTVVLSELGFAAQLSLLDATGQPIVQSGGSATSNALIDENVPAGQDFLEVQSVGTGGSYSISANFTATSQPFVNLPSEFVNAAPLAIADLNNDNIPDLITPDGVQLGTGNGTFLSTPIDGPLAQNGYHVTSIVAGDFNNNNLPDFAVLETSNDGATANVRVFLNIGADQFTPSVPLPVDPSANSMHLLNFGTGPADLALLDTLAGTMTILVGNGAGKFAPGPPIDVGDTPVAIVAGAFGNGQTDLIIADDGDYLSGTGEELMVLADDGRGQFPTIATIPLSTPPSALAAGDFGNGHLGLAIANSNAYDVTILLGNGDGTFQTQAPLSYAVGSAPDAILAYSLRDSGVLDLVTVNENSDDVSVLLGNGDGTFQPQARYAVGSFPATVAEADLNGDQRPDLLVANLRDGSGSISVLLGRGDGTFQDQIASSVGTGGAGAVSADLNDDGLVDIVTANQFSNDISVLLGNGDGTFHSAGTFAAGAGPTSLVLGDFNGDGRLDVAVTDGGDINGDGAGVSILLGNGDGTFQPPVLYSAGGYASSLVEGDFTGDGALDLAVTNPNTNTVTVLFGNGRGGFPTNETISLVGQAFEPGSITEGDFTGDGVLDLAVANQGSNNVSILRGNGKGGFVALPPISLGDDPFNLPDGIVAGEFTGNGLLDLAVMSIGSDVVSILLATGQGTFALGQPIPLEIGYFPGSVSITSGNFFPGGPLDLAVADSDSGDVLLLRGDGMGGFVVLPTYDFGSEGRPTVVTTGDYTGNGRLDIAVILQNPTSVAIELNQGNGQFVAPNSVGLVPRNTPVVADLTGDGVPDIAIVDGRGDILFRQGIPGEPGTYEPPITINCAPPSRDIAAVIAGPGLALASVDADDDEVSLIGYVGGEFTLLGTLSTGLEPAQIVSASLNGLGVDDLIIRNAGDGTLTIYMGSPLDRSFGSPITLNVGSGVSNVSVADLDRDGLADILLANQTSGQVEVISNQGGGNFGQPTLYRAGSGLSAVEGSSGTTPLSVLSQDGTIGVAAVPVGPGLPPDLVALDAGANTLGVLTGLGGDLFANPYSLDTVASTLAIRVAVLAGNGIYDLAILGPNGVTIWMGNGARGFVEGATYNVGPSPTGLTIADVNGDKRPDLIIGDAFGDVLILENQGNGTFAPPAITKNSVSLAVTQTAGSKAPTFVYANQANNSVDIQSGSQVVPLKGPTNGWLAPGAPLLADLNGDGIPDLIVINTGGNDIFVYPGLAGGGFGPSLDGDKGFAVGTNPVAVIVASLNGHPDLIVANEGSNDISVLLNVPGSNSFTFAAGPRISAGYGPVGLLYGDFYNNGSNELVVSDAGSKNLIMLPSLGDGFFGGTSLTIPLEQRPGSIVAGSFVPGVGLDIAVLDPGTSDVTLISALASGSPVSQNFPSGGIDPVAALTVPGSNGFDDLVVANNADGGVGLLVGGLRGLTLEQVNTSLEFLNPTGLALASLGINSLAVYASTAGLESALLLTFSLGGLSLGTSAQGLTLLPPGETSLPLIATFLTPIVNLNASEAQPGGAEEGSALVVAAAALSPAGLGQGPFARNLEIGNDEVDGDEGIGLDSATTGGSEKAALPSWLRVEMGLDEAFDAFRRANQPPAPPADRPEDDIEDEAPPPAPAADYRRDRQSDQTAVIDAAIRSLTSTFSRDVRTPRPERGASAQTPHVRVQVVPWQLSALAFVQAEVLMVPSRLPVRWRLATLISAGRPRGSRAGRRVRHAD